MDANKIADDLFQGLIDIGFVPEEDIAWVGVNLEFISNLDGLAFICPIRDVPCKVHRGVEFRVSQWATHDHEHLYGRFAWNITKRTHGMFDPEKNKDKESVKERLLKRKNDQH